MDATLSVIYSIAAQCGSFHRRPQNGTRCDQLSLGHLLEQRGSATKMHGLSLAPQPELAPMQRKRGLLLAAAAVLLVACAVLMVSSGPSHSASSLYAPTGVSGLANYLLFGDNPPPSTAKHAVQDATPKHTVLAAVSKSDYPSLPVLHSSRTKLHHHPTSSSGASASLPMSPIAKSAEFAKHPYRLFIERCTYCKVSKVLADSVGTFAHSGGELFIDNCAHCDITKINEAMVSTDTDAKPKRQLGKTRLASSNQAPQKAADAAQAAKAIKASNAAKAAKAVEAAKIAQAAAKKAAMAAEAAKAARAAQTAKAAEAARAAKAAEAARAAKAAQTAKAAEAARAAKAAEAARAAKAAQTAKAAEAARAAKAAQTANAAKVAEDRKHAVKHLHIAKAAQDSAFSSFRDCILSESAVCNGPTISKAIHSSPHAMAQTKKIAEAPRMRAAPKPELAAALPRASPPIDSQSIKTVSNNANDDSLPANFFVF